MKKATYSKAWDRIVWSSCNVNCGSRCPLRVFVKDGKVIRIDTDQSGDSQEKAHEIRACLRGRGIREWIYSKERLLFPLKRIGKRGDGTFKRVTWEEALDLIATKTAEIIEEYGNEAIYNMYATGNLGGVVSGHSLVNRLLNLLGGHLDRYNSYSSAQINHAMYYTYGDKQTGNHLSDIVNSKLVVFFGNNPAETRMSGGGSVRDLALAKRKSDVRVIVIDPRYTDTAACFADEWIPIRPGTDAALVCAIAYVLITEEMVDEDFLTSHCIGYDASTLPDGIPADHSYKDYILGSGSDKTSKTPVWASTITGISIDKITQLAREIGTTKPTCISQGWGPQRHAAGEQSARAICMLSILTGNVGVRGGNSGDREAPFGIPFPSIPVGENPVKTSIPCFLWTDAIEKPDEVTALNSGLMGKDKLDVPIKFIWNFAGNTLINQHSDINRTKQILSNDKKCEMIVVVDTVMTASAQFADIILPGTSPLEECDLCYQGYAVEMGTLIVKQKAIEPVGESRPLYDICTDIAQRLGIAEKFTEGRSQEDWVKHLYYKCREIKPDLPESYKEAVEIGLFKWKPPGTPHIGLKNFRKDPTTYPLNTQSGKIEIFSKNLLQMCKTWQLPEGDIITALPEYHPTWGSPKKKNSAYPLQCIGHHYKQRTHSSYGNNPWLSEAAPQLVWMNPIDAEARHIRHLDKVCIYNEIGETIVKVKVTPRIMPGVISLPQGAWHIPGKKDVDQNGCINILTSQRPSPIAKGNPQHTNLVQVERVVGLTK